MKYYSIYSGSKRGGVEIETRVYFKSGTHITKDNPLVQNNLFQVAKGKKFFDILPFADSFQHFAISKRLKLLLERSKVTGWEVFPIVIKDCDMEYFIFTPAKSIEIREFKKIYYQDEWSYSSHEMEIFTLTNTTLILCSESIKTLLEENKITNIEYIEIDENHPIYQRICD